MLEYQREVDGNQARYGRNVTGGQLATTAEYTLNVFNLQQRQKLEIQHLKHQVGQLHCRKHSFDRANGSRTRSKCGFAEHGG